MSFGNNDNFDPFKEQREQEEHRKKTALDALGYFISQFAPATKTTADTFFSTREISNSINDLTGTRLSNSDVFELMNNMGYKYEALSGLDFNWLLQKVE